MGCCGEPYENDKNQQNGHVQMLNGATRPHPVTQQPGPHPGLLVDEKPFQTPSIPSPPPSAHQFGYNVNQDQQLQQQQQWGQSSPPPGAGQFDPYAAQQSPSPQPNPSQFSGMTLTNSALQRPTPSYPGGSFAVPAMTATRITTVTEKPQQPVVDEGKMSISIDFGQIHFLDL